ncbi:MAG TPA: hypothetical protein VJY34_20265 [Roseiarcus sp.]|nr:hypothetical protein [Roseiarcus sp.]
MAIAEEAQVESERLAKLARRPKPAGEPGVIVTYDPDQKSFKNSLIAIVFATMYLEAIFYLLGTKKIGSAEYNKEHDRKCLEDKLLLFDLKDHDLRAATKRLRERRKDLIHEKADLTTSVFYAAQDEAKHAIELVKTITEKLALSKSKP